jgi:hypothetical protein
MSPSKPMFPWWGSFDQQESIFWTTHEIRSEGIVALAKAIATE